MTNLNAIAPYFTMFPLEFPFGVLERYASAGEWVLDPFCGRGTTNFAARQLGLPSIGIDSSPVASALADAKLANVSAEAVVNEAKRILGRFSTPREVPGGEFWEWAFHPKTLNSLCCLRETLLQACESEEQKALRALIMGALHGPRRKKSPIYFSNQAQRTYAPKPAYAVEFWKKRSLYPEYVNITSVLEERAYRYFGPENKVAVGKIVNADSRDPAAYRGFESSTFTWVITSPPYYGMRTYLQDQWLRHWFVGGPSRVDYGQSGQLDHGSRQRFVADLRTVWRLVASVCHHGAHLVVRFGGINDRRIYPLQLIIESLDDTGWKVESYESAGSAAEGRRQALQFSRNQTQAIEEHDIWARLQNIS
jgi:hypothetical protein